MASRIPLYFIRQFLFWMLFFQLNRLVFLLYNIGKLDGCGFWETLKAFWYAIYLDTSAACYIMIFPFVILLFQSLLKLKFLNIINKIYAGLIILLISIITSSELGIYEEWGIKLNYKAISYLSQPSEVFNTAKWSVIITGVLLIIAQFAIGFWCYHRFVHKKFELIKRNYLITALYLIVTPFLVILGLRGGLQPIPINQSEVYFSKHNILNLAAVNSAWNLIHSIEQNKFYMDKNPYLYFDREQAKQTVEQLYHTPKDSTLKVLTTERPNIVLIVLESWSADLVYSCGGYEGITPRFEKLAENGILFSNFYASGSLSDEGLAAIFSGYPAQPITSVIKQADKFQRIPCLVSSFKQRGYHTSFYYSGQLNYGNIKAYMYYNNFDKIIEGKDFDSDIPRGRLGVHDEYLFQTHIEEMNKEETPFFSSMFTLSSHSPYDQPKEETLHWGGKEKNYINSAFYTDSCIGAYIDEAKKQDWYDNTLFILVADHSHNSPKNWHPFSPDYKKIPMLFFGNVIKKKFRGMKYDKIGAQTDLVATLFAQFGMEHRQFGWSKNLLNPSAPEFAFYVFMEGFGIVKPEGFVTYQHNLDRIHQKEVQSEVMEKQLMKEGKSHLQVLFQEYLDY